MRSDWFLHLLFSVSSSCVVLNFPLRVQRRPSARTTPDDTGRQWLRLLVEAERPAEGKNQSKSGELLLGDDLQDSATEGQITA